MSIVSSRERPNAEVYLAVRKDGMNVVCQVSIALPNSNRIYSSELSVRVWDERGKPISCQPFVPGLLPVVNGIPIGIYLLDPKQNQRPASATVAYGGVVKQFKPIQWINE
jgi:hypothetical protein